jgi:hypothetical protein
MSRRLANRPRYQQARVYPQPLLSSTKAYQRQRWSYRQQRALFAKQAVTPGYGLLHLPWGWKRPRLLSELRA